MRTNPYEEAIKRFARIAAGAIGAVVCFVIDVMTLVSGTTSFTSRSGLASHVYTRADNPSQFWFIVVLYALLGIGAAWYAWAAYRE